jgi:transposase
VRNPGLLTSAERQELNALRRDLKRVRMERDFLKKAATFFARESSDPIS